MARRGNDGAGLIALLGASIVMAVVSWIAEALQTWTGRLLLLIIFGGGGWAAYRIYAWVRRGRRIKAATLAELLSLTPQRFEEAVAQLLRDEGYSRVRVHGGAGDLQADVTAVAPAGQRVVVQCKRYSPGRKVGSPTVQSFIGMATVHHRVPIGMIVTTSEFTAPAAELARRYGIDLVDGKALVDRIRRQRESAAVPTADGTPASQDRMLPPPAGPPDGNDYFVSPPEPG